ncbi:MAG: hypothetical protein JWO15_3514 [Sphingomonadales bacterium]|nr:hypothetical protein [Sphingomonadales bacterium]
MLGLAGKIKILEKLAIDNSPVLLTAMGVVGTISTAVLTHKAAIKADRIETVAIQDDYYEGLGVNKRELAQAHVKLVWKAYIPPVACGALTVTAIVMANHIGTKRTAALAAAYTVLDKAHDDYVEKVIERFGSTKEQDVRDDVVRQRLAENPPSESNVVLIGSGDVLCYDMTSGRYFNSAVEEIKKCVNDTNYQINAEGYASMSDFYDRLGLPRTSISEEMGWTSDKLMDVNFTTILSEDGRPCVAINFMTGPVRDYYKFRG